MDAEKRQFVLRKGVLGVGLPVAVLMSLTAAFQKPGSVFQLESFKPGTFVLFLAIFAPIFMAAGWVWGLMVYKFRRKK